jgi:hypothetical protein
MLPHDRRELPVDDDSKEVDAKLALLGMELRLR